MDLQQLHFLLEEICPSLCRVYSLAPGEITAFASNSHRSGNLRLFLSLPARTIEAPAPSLGSAACGHPRASGDLSGLRPLFPRF